MKKELRHEDVEPLTLETIPEIREEYVLYGWEPMLYHDDNWIQEMYSFPSKDPRRMGSTIVFENILVPFVISLFENEPKNQQKIQEIMDFIEMLAKHKDIRISGTLVEVCFCEGILSHSKETLPRIFPYMGSETQRITKPLLDR